MKYCRDCEYSLLAFEIEEYGDICWECRKEDEFHKIAEERMSKNVRQS